MGTTTPGSARLAFLLAQGTVTLAQVAAATGAGSDDVAAWAAGAATPSLYACEALRQLVGLPAAAWLTHAEMAAVLNVAKIRVAHLGPPRVTR